MHEDDPPPPADPQINYLVGVAPSPGAAPPQNGGL